MEATTDKEIEQNAENNDSESEVKINPNSAALLVHLGGILFGFLPSLIVKFALKSKSQLLNSQVNEALNFQITMTVLFVASIVLDIMGLFFIGILVKPAIWVFNLVFCIIAALAVKKGEDYKYPFSIRLIE